MIKFTSKEPTDKMKDRLQYLKGKSGTTPLVDTGQLYNDFDLTITGK